MRPEAHVWNQKRLKSLYLVNVQNDIKLVEFFEYQQIC